MTQFGDQPGRDRIETTQEEREAFALLAGNYGAYEDPGTEVAANIEFCAELPAEPEAPTAPMGCGFGKVEEARAALAAARKAQDSDAIVTTHNAWMDLGDTESPFQEMRRNAALQNRISLALGACGGILIGFGIGALTVAGLS